MVERKISLSSFSLSINARGATVPLSPGLVEMLRNKDCKAEYSVGGDEGMGWGATEVFELEDSAGFPNVEGRRSAFRLTGTIGIGGLLSAEEGNGEPVGGDSESKASCRIRSLNGVQKYRAWRTELA
jgi:hypothetical protein